MRNTHPGKTAKVIRNVVKNFDTKPPVSTSSPVDTPNAINVITPSPIHNSANKVPVVKTNPPAVPFMNVPLKLAFKTSAFKNHYNIHRYSNVLMF